MDVSVHHSLPLVPERGEWSASRPCRFTPEETAPINQHKEAWMSPESVGTICIKVCYACQESIHGSSTDNSSVSIVR
jgi:hypothetical protein